VRRGENHRQPKQRNLVLLPRLHLSHLKAEGRPS
jgi:hypothetical protein